MSMLHSIRWTTKKIAQRLKLIEQLVHRRSQPLAPLRYRELSSPKELPLVDSYLDDHEWTVIAPFSYWSGGRTNFMLRGEFQVPADWSNATHVALHLPLGDAGEFEHPEALVYIDGQSYAAVDRHHQEILLPSRWCDGQPHTLALHGWTGNLTWLPLGTKLFMQQCSIVAIDRPACSCARPHVFVRPTASPARFDMPCAL